ncbi:hypothetical protein DFR70_101761 [Nocardia tenerifensis]|uniref:Uncharacterized protein n=1 Tax=Nocardia tenerifensis TaxID=228006 RepID=A0A318KEU5_9NOCA|nr:hypothetical protein [Nocardia tenerifensis]PXX71339.1 hypothetical protein DFR70_101761 [Nocardia tenerifensis]
MRTAFRDPVIPDGEKSVYLVGVADEPPAFEVTSVVTRAAHDYYSTVEVRAADGDPTITVEQRFSRVDGWLRAADYRAETRSRQTVVSREEAHFLDTTHLQFGSGVGPFPPNVMPFIGGLTLLRGLDFAEGTEIPLDLWLAFSVHWPVTARVQKQAVVDVPAGRAATWPVHLRPGFAHVNSLLDKMIGGFIPSSFAHFDVEPPHRLVRFDFPTEPGSAPRGVMELVA